MIKIIPLASVLLLFVLLTSCGYVAPKNIFLASQKGDSHAVSTYIELGLDVNVVNDKGITPLIAAADRGHAKVVNILIMNGAVVNLADRRFGRTPLMWACLRGYVDTVKVLLDNGAETNMIDTEGNTALVLAAAIKGNGEIVKVLIKYDVDVNIENNNGLTALDIATNNNISDIVEIFMKHIK